MAEKPTDLFDDEGQGSAGELGDSKNLRPGGQRSQNPDVDHVEPPRPWNWEGHAAHGTGRRHPSMEKVDS